MKAKFASARLLKQIVEGTKELLVDVNIECSVEGLSIAGMDASHVSLCSIQLSTAGMLFYECPQPLRIGVHLASLSKILSSAGTDDQLELETSTAMSSSTLCIRVLNETRLAVFELPLMDIDEESVAIPEGWQGDRVLHIPSSDFQRIIRDLAVMGDSCRIELRVNDAAFSVNGELGKAHITVEANNGVTIVQNCPSDTSWSLEFAIRYIQSFTKCGQTDATAILASSPNQPLKLTYANPSWGSIVFFLAPKMEE